MTPLDDFFYLSAHEIHSSFQDYNTKLLANVV